MKIVGKVGLLLFVFIVGAILAGVAHSYYESGNFIILGATAAILLYIFFISCFLINFCLLNYKNNKKDKL